jgi:hypothetical protein
MTWSLPIRRRTRGCSASETAHAAPGVLGFRQSPKLLSVLARLLGPDIRLHGSKLNTKDPKYGSL